MGLFAHFDRKIGKIWGPHKRPIKRQLLILRNRFKKLRVELKRIKNPEYRYYKYYYARKILSSKPITCKPNTDIEIHVLYCKKNILDSLWSLKTFFYYSGLQADLYIHSDGSLKQRHKNIYRKHFTNCNIIDRKDATEKMATYLRKYETSLQFRRRKPFYCSLKLFDPLFFSKQDNIFYIDSDILFFNKPDELIANVKKHQPFFNSDMEDSYSASAERLDDLFNVTMCRKFNAGLIYYNRQKYLKRLDFIEHFFQTVEKYHIRCSVGPNHHEQTLHAIFGSFIGSQRLGEKYQPGNKDMTDDTISCHFFSGARPTHFYTKGLKMLKKQRFIEKFNQNKK
jgi:hypothetical protein